VRLLKWKTATAGALCALGCAAAVATGAPTSAPRGAAAETPAQKCADVGVVIMPARALAGRSASEPRATVGGWAFLDGSRPLEGASVRLETDGKRVLRTRTGDTGAFLIGARELPARFTIEASGGRVSGEPFHGTLRTEVRNYSAERPATAYVSPASTLVGSYLASHPARSVGTASAHVKTFLGVPQSLALTYDLRSSSALFDGSRFLADARGHVNRLLSRLARELNRGGASHPFRGTQPPQGIAGDIFKFVGKELAVGAVNYVGHLGMGWVLSEFGIDDGVAGQMDQISSRLDQISAQLTTMGAQLNDLQKAVNDQLLTSIANDLSDARAVIRSRMDDLRYVADMSQQVPRPSAQEIERSACQALAKLKDLAGGTTPYGYAEVKINQSFFPEASGSIALTDAALRVIHGKYRWWTEASRAEVEKLVSYWIGVEASWLSLKLEWEHAVNPCAPTATVGTCESLRWASTFLSDSAAQRDTLPPPVPRGTWIDQSTNLMWAPTYVNTSFANPPPATFRHTFPADLDNWNLDQVHACNDYSITLCAIEGKHNNGQEYGFFTDWRPPSDAEIGKLIDGRGSLSPAAYLSADEPAGPGVPAAWLSQGDNYVWTGSCARVPDPVSPGLRCVRYNLADGTHPGVRIDDEDQTAGFLLVRNTSPVWWTGHTPARYVSTQGSDTLGVQPNTCASYPTPCKTIAQAVNQAAAGDIIRIGGGTFSGGIAIGKSVMLSGNGANLTIISGGNPGVNVVGGSPKLEGITLSGGQAGLWVAGGATVVDSAISGISGTDGSALRVTGGKATLMRSAVADNSFSKLSSPVNVVGGVLDLINSSVVHNAGGIHVGSGASLDLINASIVKNDLNPSGLIALQNEGGYVYLENTLVAGNSTFADGDCRGQLTALPGGHNLIGSVGLGGGTFCKFDPMGSSGNMIGSYGSVIDPKIGTIGPNGGTTTTVALLAGSPAVGAADAETCADPAGTAGVDQRGWARPPGSCDIGAFDTKAVDIP
jgi:hypothetical protein